jgi:three-Cys-motif partner protein
MKAMVEHDFGGPWTEIKLDAVQYYLECYTKALTQKQFDLWYIDAFAGTGDRVAKRQVGGLFEGRALEMLIETLAGSARRALAVQPAFHHFTFVEQDDARRSVLTKLIELNPTRDIKIIPGDANDVLKQIFSVAPWQQRSKGKARGIVFLDPYSLQVEWQTLVALARTEAVDVWYLFPLRDVTRQLAHKLSGIGPKEARLDKVLGPEWRDLYSLPTPTEEWTQAPLFGEPDEVEPQRNATQKQIETWFHNRLKKEFGYASPALPILTGENRQIFSLFLAVANKSKPATDLAEHFAKYVMKNFAPGAFRRTSYP